jgi:hypothetical protein
VREALGVALLAGNEKTKPKAGTKASKADAKLEAKDDEAQA